MDFSRREDSPELMDTEALPEGELRATLRFLSRSSRFLGGDALVLHYLDSWSGSWPKSITVLDVGTGGGDLPVRLLGWADRKGVELRVTAIDSTPAIAALAREAARPHPRIEVVETDLAAFARKGRSFDVVLCSLVLHHVPDEGLAAFLRACDALARRAVVIGDLERSRAAYWSVKALTAAFGNRVTRHDGPASVRRAFTAPELDELARSAGLGYLLARRHPFFRLSLAGRKPL